MRILIAEDEPDIYDLYRIALEERNHQVLIARDGEECLKMYVEELRNQDSLLLEEASVMSAGSIGVEAKEKPELLDDRDDHRDNFPDSGNSLLSSSFPSSSSSSSSVSSLSYPSSLRSSPFDAVVLDYRMPKRDGIEVAKEILKLNSKQRIIFASAYIKESLEDCVKELDQVVELMQKPFEPEILVDTIEDREISSGLEKMMINLRAIKDQYSDPTLDQIRDLLEGLRKIQKGRTF